MIQSELILVDDWTRFLCLMSGFSLYQCIEFHIVTLKCYVYLFLVFLQFIENRFGKGKQMQLIMFIISLFYWLLGDNSVDCTRKTNFFGKRVQIERKLLYSRCTKLILHNCSITTINNLKWKMHQDNYYFIL